MTHWLSRFLMARPTAGRHNRANFAPLASRLLVGVMATILFGVDSLRPVVGLSNTSHKDAPAQKKPGDKPTQRSKCPDSSAIWTTPWIPPATDVSPRLPLELVLRAASNSSSVSPTSSGSLPAWTMPTDAAACWQAHRLTAVINPLLAAQDRPFDLLTCRQICPVGPPSV